MEKSVGDENAKLTRRRRPRAGRVKEAFFPGPKAAGNALGRNPGFRELESPWKSSPLRHAPANANERMNIILGKPI